jgi:hypothetical protein
MEICPGNTPSPLEPIALSGGPPFVSNVRKFNLTTYTRKHLKRLHDVNWIVTQNILKTPFRLKSILSMSGSGISNLWALVWVVPRYYVTMYQSTLML